MKRLRPWLPALLGGLLGVGLVAALPAEWLLVADHGAGHGVHQEVWACPMLCVKRDGPGLCPVCGMQLELIADGRDGAVLSRRQAGLIGLQTVQAERRPLFRELRTVGTLDFNQRRVKTISAWVAGRIERLYADSTYTEVRQDDHVLRLYSPELYATQRELLAGGASRVARRKLELLGLRPRQLDELLRTRQASEHVDILSPLSGRITELRVSEGQYVQVGTPLCTVADYSSLWLRFDAYEEDLPWIAVGQAVEVSLDAQPGSFAGTVSFLEGVVDSVTRTTKVRVTVDNSAGGLLPGMFARVRLRAALGPDGSAQGPSLAGRFVCYMHPEQRADTPGSCPICGMAFELAVARSPVSPEERPADPGGHRWLALPREAVLSTGERHVVYRQASPGRFELRVVEVGVRAGEWLQILGGLQEGDTVVRRGAFLIDSQRQLSGLPSLLLPGGATGGGPGTPGGGGHGQH